MESFSWLGMYASMMAYASITVSCSMGSTCAVYKES